MHIVCVKETEKKSLGLVFQFSPADVEVPYRNGREKLCMEYE
jgi:hypothetical protein